MALKRDPKEDAYLAISITKYNLISNCHGHGVYQVVLENRKERVSKRFYGSNPRVPLLGGRGKMLT